MKPSPSLCGDQVDEGLRDAGDRRRHRRRGRTRRAGTAAPAPPPAGARPGPSRPARTRRARPAGPWTASPIFSTAEPRARGVVDRALVLVDQRPASPPPSAELWSRIGGTSPMSAQTVPNSGWLCTAQPTSWRSLCSSRCSGIPSGTGQSPSTTLPSRSMRMTWDGRSSAQVSSHGLHSSVPSPRLTVMWPGQVVVVALPPQGAGQDHELLARREVGDQLLGGRA